MIGSESMSLHGWKQLAKWSLEHSCMDPDQLVNVTQEWERRWQEYCQWIVDTYGPTNPDLANWQPTVARH
jgi:adenosine deaminase CECR1